MTKQELHNLINSWENLELIISDAAAQPELLDNLIHIALNSKDSKSWRAAWMIEKVNDINPKQIKPYINHIVEKLKEEESSSKKRHFLKLISLHDINQDHQSFLFEYCLNQFSSDTEPVAVRVHALQILYNITEIIPALKPELLSVIEYENEKTLSAGIKARNRKLTKKLHRQIKSSGIHLS